MKDVAALRNKRFLDLGCGTGNCPDSLFPEHALSAPWFCRYAYESGARVVGIDIEPQWKSEGFMSYRLDLSKVGALSFIPDKSFDFVICNRLIIFSDIGGDASPSFVENEKGERRGLEELKAIASELKTQIERILEIGGKMLNDFDYGRPNVYQKIGDVLVKIK